MLQDFECPPELMIAEMDYAGVDMGILHCYVTKGHYRTQNGFQRQAVRRHPDRLMRTIMVSEPEVPEDPDRALREVQEEVAFGGHTAVQFIPRNYYAPIVPSLKGMGRTEPWADEVMRPFWDGVASMKVPVFFTILGRGGALRDRYGHSALDEYFEEQRVLLCWMERYPEVTVVITHGLPWRAFLEGDRVEFPEHIWDVFKAPQLNMEMIIPIQMGGDVGVPLGRGGGNSQRVRRPYRGRQAHVGIRLADGGPVLHICAKPEPVQALLRFPQQGRAGLNHRRHGGPHHGN